MTQSKLGLHLQRLTPDARQWLSAGARLARLTGDLSAARVLAELHPDALLIGAAQNQVDLALEARHGARAEVSARAFVNAQRGAYDQYPQITGWEGPTAPALGPAANYEALRLMAWYAAFEAERVNALAELGLRAVVGNFASGGPDLPLWSAFLPALDAAETHAGWLGLQEHSAPWLWSLTGARQPVGSPAPELKEDSSALTGWTTLRYRLVRERALRPNGLDALPIIITSLRLDRIAAGDPDRPTGPWTELLDFWREQDGEADPIPYWRAAAETRDPARYIAEQLAWYDGEIQRDPQVVGAVVGIVGADDAHAAYELAGTPVSDYLVDHLRTARPFGSAGVATLPAPRLVPRGPELPRLTRENLLDRRGFDEGWVEDADVSQELAVPLGWRLRHVEGKPASAEIDLPAFGRPFATLLGSTDVRAAERPRLFAGVPYVWRVASRTPLHVALEQVVQGLVPGMRYAFSARVMAEPIVRDQPRVVYAPDQAASELRCSILNGAVADFPTEAEPLATSGWLTGEAVDFGRYGDLRAVFSAPAEAVTVRVEIRSRYALSLAAWHVQPPILAPEADEAPAAADEAAS